MTKTTSTKIADLIDPGDPYRSWNHGHVITLTHLTERKSQWACACGAGGKGQNGMVIGVIRQHRRIVFPNFRDATLRERVT